MAAMKIISGLIFGASLLLLQGCLNRSFNHPDQVQIETPGFKTIFPLFERGASVVITHFIDFRPLSPN
jgi:hypothetical protein